ncbi:hypothetical protein COD05_06215 [Bacillus cereus]|uniref:DUF1643 domain-containing protein n=1 Tax=Bacillus sp. AW TaxID=2293329 RepID=UPI000BF69AA2|nr:hypothetical protein COJ53_07145 [Bacillus cereus]PGP32398.1 hypothetical protein CN989_28200 [Bacillus cereus]PGT11591.1 hypothetical protein COD05_06215 [Bacillus cereus]RFB76217.1 DUF1643 domain-containing protein [Bacillus sp. AW]
MDYKRKHIIGEVICDKKLIVKTNERLIEKRELLQVELNKKGTKMVTIVMMNPSKADSKQSDGTVNKVIEYFVNPFLRPLNERDRRIDDLKYLNIINLIPLYNPKPSGLVEDIDEIISQFNEEYLKLLLESNIRKIETIMSESDYIVLAWGMPEKMSLPLYYEQVAKILKGLESLDKDIYVLRVRGPKGSEYHFTGHLNPPHPSRCKILGLVRVDVKDLYRIVPRPH